MSAPVRDIATYGRLSTLPVNVADFGLICDGNLDTRGGTDNLAAFNEAIARASLVPASKRAVYVPPGTYPVSDTIVNPSRLRFYGDDRAHAASCALSQACR